MRQFFKRVVENPNTGIGSGAYLLDRIPCAAAYSLRRLRSLYTGPCMQVRRSNDNAIYDVGFDALGKLNTAALLAFIGSNNGLVVRWYDQSGNGYNAIQTATASAQPTIVAAGVVNVVNTLSGILFDGVNDGLVTGTQAPLYSAGLTKNAVFVANGMSTQLVFSSDSAPRNYIQGDCSINMGNGAVGASGLTVGLNVLTATVQGTGSTTQTRYLNGVSASGSTTRSSTSGVITLGAFGPAASSNYYSGTIAEAIQWNRVLSDADRQTVEANQKAYYGTP